jgi:hypothetical protein
LQPLGTTREGAREKFSGLGGEDEISKNSVQFYYPYASPSTDLVSARRHQRRLHHGRSTQLPPLPLCMDGRAFGPDLGWSWYGTLIGRAGWTGHFTDDTPGGGRERSEYLQRAISYMWTGFAVGMDGGQGNVEIPHGCEFLLG